MLIFWHVKFERNIKMRGKNNFVFSFLKMLDHLVGKPSSNFKRVQVLLTLVFG